MLELWQADANGKYNHPPTRSRKLPTPTSTASPPRTDDEGLCIFETVKPEGEDKLRTST